MGLSLVGSFVIFHWSFVPSLQFSSFLSDMSNVRGVANRRGIAVCSVAPNLPSTSACRSDHSPAHKVSWEGEETREDGLDRMREEREEEWGQRAFELERTQRDNSPQGKTATMCMHKHTHAHTHTFCNVWSSTHGHELSVLHPYHHLHWESLFHSYLCLLITHIKGNGPE